MTHHMVNDSSCRKITVFRVRETREKSFQSLSLVALSSTLRRIESAWNGNKDKFFFVICETNISETFQKVHKFHEFSQRWNTHRSWSLSFFPIKLRIRMQECVGTCDIYDEDVRFSKTKRFISDIFVHIRYFVRFSCD